MLDTSHHSLGDGDVHLGISGVQFRLVLFVERARSITDVFVIGLSTRTSVCALIELDTPHSNAKEDHGGKNDLVIHSDLVLARGRAGVSYEKVMDEKPNLGDVQCAHLVLEVLNDELV